MTGTQEYQELKEAGLSDDQIKMMRNLGASHMGILLYALLLQAEKLRKPEIAQKEN